MILQQKNVLTELNNEHWWFNQENMNLAMENIDFSSRSKYDDNWI